MAKVSASTPGDRAENLLPRRLPGNASTLKSGCTSIRPPSPGATPTLLDNGYFQASCPNHRASMRISVPSKQQHMVRSHLLSGGFQPDLHPTLSLKRWKRICCNFVNAIQHTMPMVDQKDLSFAQIKILVQILKHLAASRVRAYRTFPHRSVLLPRSRRLNISLWR